MFQQENLLNSICEEMVQNKKNVFLNIILTFIIQQLDGSNLHQFCPTSDQFKPFIKIYI